jgi:hypothetical protein
MFKTKEGGLGKSRLADCSLESLDSDLAGRWSSLSEGRVAFQATRLAPSTHSQG